MVVIQSRAGFYSEGPGSVNDSRSAFAHPARLHGWMMSYGSGPRSGLGRPPPDGAIADAIAQLGTIANPIRRWPLRGEKP